MPRPIQPNTPQSRDRAEARLRRATRVVVLGATGAAALIGVVVAAQHPGSGSTGTRSTGGSTGATGSSTSGSSTSSNSGTSDNAGSSSSNTGSTGNTGNTGASNTPSISNSSPAVTSGGTSGR
jgi:hypothetical protein